MLHPLQAAQLASEHRTALQDNAVRGSAGSRGR
jgi:hypothetical protein